MSFFKRQKALVIGASIIVLTNAVALAGVAYNRSGTVDSQLQLSERELSYNIYQRDDNSGIAVNLLWKVLSKDILGAPRKDSSYDWYNYSHEAHWLTDAKIAELGFDIKAPVYREAGVYRYKQLKDREVFLVLEFNGPAYATYVRQSLLHAKVQASKEEAVRQIKEAQHEASRLFVVDAGIDADSLRRRYPNRAMYVIAKGVIGASWKGVGDKTELNAYISRLSVNSLHVPKPLDAVFSGYNAGNPAKLQYLVDVDYGKRHEPWITSARKTAP